MTIRPILMYDCLNIYIPTWEEEEGRRKEGRKETRFCGLVIGVMIEG